MKKPEVGDKVICQYGVYCGTSELGEVVGQEGLQYAVKFADGEETAITGYVGVAIKLAEGDYAPGTQIGTYLVAD